jgi:hypothetical protein
MARRSTRARQLPLPPDMSILVCLSGGSVRQLIHVEGAGAGTSQPAPAI